MVFFKKKSKEKIERKKSVPVTDLLVTFHCRATARCKNQCGR